MCVVVLLVLMIGRKQNARFQSSMKMVTKKASRAPGKYENYQSLRTMHCKNFYFYAGVLVAPKTNPVV